MGGMAAQIQQGALPEVSRQTPRIRGVALRPLLEGPFLPPDLSRALLQTQGLEEAALHDPYGWVPLANYITLLERAAEALRAPCLGAQVGCLHRPEHAGPFGALFLTGSTLGEICHEMAGFWPLMQSHTEVGFEANGSSAVLSYRITDQEIAQRGRQDAQLTIAAMAGFNKLILGDHWRPEEVQFVHAPLPGTVNILQNIFGAPVVFHAQANRLIFAKSDLAARNLVATPALEPIMRRHLQDLLAEETQHDASPQNYQNFPAQVRIAVMAALELGQVSLADSAAKLNMSERSFQRKLAAHGIAFRQVLESCRKELAQKLLEKPGTQVKAVANLLGYSELSSFSRAYKGWTGRSPRTESS